MLVSSIGAIAPQTEHLPVGRTLLLQPQAQRLADRRGPRQAPLAAERIKLIAPLAHGFRKGSRPAEARCSEARCIKKRKPPYGG